MEAGEECDDGNNTRGDGCDEICQRERASCCNHPSVTCNSDAACPGGDTCCLAHCTDGVGVPACPGFVGAEVVPATVKRTKFIDREPDQVLQWWKTKGSFILTGSQATRLDPERQNVQVRLAERDPQGVRVDLWPASPVVQPDICTPNLFCFPRSGRPTRFKWKKVNDQAEVFSPGLRKGRF